MSEHDHEDPAILWIAQCPHCREFSRQGDPCPCQPTTPTKEPHEIAISNALGAIQHLGMKLSETEQFFFYAGLVIKILEEMNNANKPS